MVQRELDRLTSFKERMWQKKRSVSFYEFIEEKPANIISELNL